ncbi:MAG TPA: hypothetical protein VFE52_01905 [Devosia sp.]|jgi:hypothetical protein|nr:hypothetical protein [Devosia sp.]
MPRYFFDVRDRHGEQRDEVGLEFPDMETAIAEARRALGDIVRESLLDGGSDETSITIRDGADGPVNLVVTLRTERPDQSR